MKSIDISNIFFAGIYIFYQIKINKYNLYQQKRPTPVKKQKRGHGYNIMACIAGIA